MCVSTRIATKSMHTGPTWTLLHYVRQHPHSNQMYAHRPNMYAVALHATAPTYQPNVCTQTQHEHCCITCDSTHVATKQVTDSMCWFHFCICQDHRDVNVLSTLHCEKTVWWQQYKPWQQWRQLPDVELSPSADKIDLLTEAGHPPE